MNAHKPIGAARLEPLDPTGEAGATNLPTFDIGEGAYIATEADFPDGCFVRHDVGTGRRIATGENKLGITVTLELGVPLCSGCDQPLDNGVCSDCRMVFPTPRVQQVADGEAAIARIAEVYRETHRVVVRGRG